MYPLTVGFINLDKHFKNFEFLFKPKAQQKELLETASSLALERAIVAQRVQTVSVGSGPGADKRSGNGGKSDELGNYEKGGKVTTTTGDNEAQIELVTAASGNDKDSNEEDNSEKDYSSRQEAQIAEDAARDARTTSLAVADAVAQLDGEATCEYRLRLMFVPIKFLGTVKVGDGDEATNVLVRPEAFRMLFYVGFIVYIAIGVIVTMLWAEDFDEDDNPILETFGLLFVFFVPKKVHFFCRTFFSILFGKNIFSTKKKQKTQKHNAI